MSVITVMPVPLAVFAASAAALIALAAAGRFTAAAPLAAAAGRFTAAARFIIAAPLAAAAVPFTAAAPLAAAGRLTAAAPLAAAKTPTPKNAPVRTPVDEDPRKPTGGSPLERVTVNLILRASRALQRVSELTGDSKTDSINRAIQVYGYLTEIDYNGGAIYVRESKDSEPQLLKMF
jgi:uncharacterized protein YciI